MILQCVRAPVPLLPPFQRAGSSALAMHPRSGVPVRAPVKRHISKILRCHSNVRYHVKTTKQVQQ